MIESGWKSSICENSPYLERERHEKKLDEISSKSIGNFKFHRLQKKKLQWNSVIRMSNKISVAILKMQY